MSATEKKSTPKAKKTKVVNREGESTVDSPVKVVRELAEKMTKADPKVARKDIIKAAMAKGVAYYTAATQYQLWRKGQKKSK